MLQNHTDFEDKVVYCLYVVSNLNDVKGERTGQIRRLKERRGEHAEKSTREEKKRELYVLTVSL